MVILNSCINCGELQLYKNSGFCAYCFSKIEKLYFRDVTNQNSEYFFLLNWIPHKSDSISNLLTILKEYRRPHQVQFYSELLAAILINQIKDKHIVLVPIPGSKPERNLSLMLANGLGKILSLEVWDVLIKTNCAKSQKNKSKTQRKSITFKIDEKFTSDCKNKICEKTIIIVDDISTTGSSLKAASRALRGAKKIVGITLAYRTSLAYPSR